MKWQPGTGVIHSLPSNEKTTNTSQRRPQTRLLHCTDRRTNKQTDTDEQTDIGWAKRLPAARACVRGWARASPQTTTAHGQRRVCMSKRALTLPLWDPHRKIIPPLWPNVCIHNTCVGLYGSPGPARFTWCLPLVSNSGLIVFGWFSGRRNPLLLMMQSLHDLADHEPRNCGIICIR